MSDLNLELYNTPHSTCSQKVRLCLWEKGLGWTDHHIDLATNEHLTPNYLKINPNGVVPTLIHDGKLVHDSSVICEYLDEIAPDPNLTPADPHQRATMRAWMRFFEEVPTVAIRVPSFNMAFLPRFEGLGEEDFREMQSDIRPLRKQFYRRMGPDGFNVEDFEAALEQIVNTCRRMEGALSNGGPWLLGEAYTLADVIGAPLIDRMEDLGFSYLWEEDFPAMTAWFARMKDRPAFQETFFPLTRLSEKHDLAGPTC